jgi:hypothetical protein
MAVWPTVLIPARQSERERKKRKEKRPNAYMGSRLGFIIVIWYITLYPLAFLLSFVINSAHGLWLPRRCVVCISNLSISSAEHLSALYSPHVTRKPSCAWRAPWHLPGTASCLSCSSDYRPRGRRGYNTCVIHCFVGSSFGEHKKPLKYRIMFPEGMKRNI